MNGAGADGDVSARRRVRLVGEDALALAGLSALLADHEWEVSEDSDVVLWLVEEGSGPGAIEMNEDDEIPVLALVPDEAHAPAVLRAGARGVLLRDAEPRRVASALDAVRFGFIVLDPTVAESSVLARPAAVLPEEALTPRELEVLELLSMGLSNKGIAERLGVSPHTAKFHVNSVLGKLGAASRTEAVAIAARSGLVRF